MKWSAGDLGDWTVVQRARVVAYLTTSPSSPWSLIPWDTPVENEVDKSISE